MSKRKRRRKSKHLPPRFDVIEAAVAGNFVAMHEVLFFYDAYITKLSRITIYDENGEIHRFIDEDKKNRLKVQLMEKILYKFQLDKYL